MFVLTVPMTNTKMPFVGSREAARSLSHLQPLHRDNGGIFPPAASALHSRLHRVQVTAPASFPAEQRQTPCI